MFWFDTYFPGTNFIMISYKRDNSKTNLLKKLSYYFIIIFQIQTLFEINDIVFAMKKLL